MGNKNLYNWIEEGKFDGISANVGFECEECIVEAVDGFGSSVVVSLSAVGDEPISIMMNGEEVSADIVLFSLEREEERGEFSI